MIRKLLALLTFIILPNLLWAQYSISLNKSNTYHYGNSYLIDIPFKKEIKNLYVKDFEGLIPIQTFRNLHIATVDEIQSLSKILVVKKAALDRKHTNNYPFDEYIIAGSYKSGIDTLNGIDDSLATYKSIIKRLKYKKSTLIYYIEWHGTVGGGDDSILYEKRNNLKKFIEEFEKTNQVRIGEMFANDDGGHEGGIIYYFTLSGLTGEQKIKFIDERKNSLNINELKNASVSIYLPYLEANNRLKPPIVTKEMQEKIDADKIYTQVEVMPKYPDGEEAFKELFKNIHFNVEVPTKAIIQFIVAKNGSLTDIKIVRGGDKQIEKQVKKIIKLAKNWNPGMHNGKPVKVAVVCAIPYSQ